MKFFRLRAGANSDPDAARPQGSLISRLKEFFSSRSTVSSDAAPARSLKRTSPWHLRYSPRIARRLLERKWTL